MKNAAIDACLVKPVRQAQLCEAMASAAQTRSLGALSGRLESSRQRVEEPATVRILVADASAANQKVLVYMLEGLGVRADVAANGREAIEMLRLLSYDLVLMDCRMPEMDGFTATRKIRAKESPEGRTVILAMIAEVSAEDHERLIECGADDVLLKPVRGHQLEAALRKWLPLSRGDGKTLQAQSTVHPGAAADPGSGTDASGIAANARSLPAAQNVDPGPAGRSAVYR